MVPFPTGQIARVALGLPLDRRPSGLGLALSTCIARITIQTYATSILKRTLTGFMPPGSALDAEGRAPGAIPQSCRTRGRVWT